MGSKSFIKNIDITILLHYHTQKLFCLIFHSLNFGIVLTLMTSLFFRQGLKLMSKRFILIILHLLLFPFKLLFVWEKSDTNWITKRNKRLVTLFGSSLIGK